MVKVGEIEIQPQAVIGTPPYVYATATRDLSLATGTVAYTGVGFKPSALDLIGCVNGTNRYGSGFLNGGATQPGISTNSSGLWVHTSTTGHRMYGTTTSDFQEVRLSSFDSDGFTLNFVKTGSPTGLGLWKILVFK